MIRVVGHRGAAGIEPENTLRSFRRALELGVDIIECDVRLTKDGRMVLMHDRTVDRTTNGSGAVEDFTFDEIRKLDAGKGERVPTLEELLDLVGDRVTVHIELKDPNAYEQVLDLVGTKGLEETVCLTSGDTDALARVRMAHPTIAMEHIFGNPPVDAVEKALRVRAQKVSCRFNHLRRDFVDEAHAHGLEVIAWPPNTEEEMQHAVNFGVDNICTDRPDVLIPFLERKGLR